MDLMNCVKACSILEINDENYTHEQVRKQYKYMALKWHPDKNPAPNSAEKYMEIKAAHDYLIGHSTQEKISSYKSCLTAFFVNLYGNEEFQRTIFMPLLELCEEKIIKMIVAMPDSQAKLTYQLLCAHKDVLNLSDVFLDKIQRAIANKDANICYLLLNPCLQDMLDCNVYKFTDCEEPLYIPLWRPCTEFVEHDVVAYCLPQLPGNIWIEEESWILHISIDADVNVVFSSGFLEVPIGNAFVHVLADNIKLVPYQIVKKPNSGLPLLCDRNIYAHENRGDLHIHLHLFENFA